MLEEGMMQPLRGKGEHRVKAQERLPSIQTRASHPMRRRFGKDRMEERHTGAKVVHLRNVPVYTGTRLFGARERKFTIVGTIAETRIGAV
jgi:hypothetical protein